MAINLLKIVQKKIDKESINKISEQLDINSDKIEAAVNVLLPTLLKGICYKNTTSTSAKVFFNTLSNRSQSGDKHLSDKMIAASLFSENATVINHIANQTELTEKSIENLSEIVTGQILDQLTENIKSDKLSATGLMDLLYSQKTVIDESLSDEMQDLTHYADASLRDTESHFGKQLQDQGSSTGWWKWMLGSLLSIFILGWLFKPGYESATESFKEGFDAGISIEGGDEGDEDESIKTIEHPDDQNKNIDSLQQIDK